MMASVQFFVSLLFLLIWLILGYKPWFHPEEYIDQQITRRSSSRKPKLLPHAVTFSLFPNNPQLDLWSARIISLLGVFICLAIILAPLF